MYLHDINFAYEIYYIMVEGAQSEILGLLFHFLTLLSAGACAVLCAVLCASYLKDADSTEFSN